MPQTWVYKVSRHLCVCSPFHVIRHSYANENTTILISPYLKCDSHIMEFEKNYFIIVRHNRILVSALDLDYNVLDLFIFISQTVTVLTLHIVFYVICFTFYNI